MYCWLDSEPGEYAEASVLIEFHTYRRRHIRIVLLAPNDTHRKRHRGDIGLIGAEAIAMGEAVITGDCLAAVFADWIEEHPESWTAAYYDDRPPTVSVPELCEWLRKMQTLTTIK